MKCVNLFFLLALTFLVTLAGCAKVGGGPPPQAMSDNPERYTFKIHVDDASSMLSPESPDQRARKQIEFYRENHGYSSFEIVNKRPMGSPLSYYEYEVQFAKRPEAYGQ